MRQAGDDNNRHLAGWLLGYSEVLSTALLMVLPAVVGIACDAWLGTSHWCVVVGAVVGLFSGLLRLMKMPSSATGQLRPKRGASEFGETASPNTRGPGVVAGHVPVLEPGTASADSNGSDSDP